MARISRQPAKELPEGLLREAFGSGSAPGRHEEDRSYNTAVYARLSVEDGGRSKEESIENQVEFLKAYLRDKTELTLAGIYRDNGYSGTGFLRPGWNRLMEEVRAGRVNCILVKDLSRFGRNYIETGDYLEHIFPLLGVRFIAVNDRYDSSNREAGSDGMGIAVKNLVNDYYAREISCKVSAAARMKQKKGEYQGSHPPYGYLYSAEGTHRLVIDEETAPVIKQIFNLLLEGYSSSRAADFLNGSGILSPSCYFYRLGYLHSERYADEKPWGVSTIGKIAANQVYLGHTVRGKTLESLCCGIPRHSIPEEERIIIPNTHEALISEELFHKVRERKAACRRDLPL